MTMTLTMKLLGELSLMVDGERIDPLRSRTAAALFVYLACEQRPFSRDYLAGFFWEARDSSQAAANLRTALKLLRRPFAPYLTITRQTVAFNPDAPHEIDALDFAQQLGRLPLQGTIALETADHLSRVLELYQGNFLEGFHLPNASGFEMWQTLQREHYQRLAESGLRQLTQFNLDQGRYPAGVETAARLLALNPLDEAGQRHMMELLWRSGQRNAALQQYEMLRRLLSHELDVPPTAETHALYKRIRATQHKHNLPSEATPFIGRASEIRALEDYLSTPDCRLLTILGPGGVGKTRLLIALGHKRAAHAPGRFPHGVRYVPLAHLDSAQYLATAVAENLSVPLSGGEEPLAELLNYLRQKELLLLLDNFEHLLDDPINQELSLTFIEKILQQAPLLKLVVTSRARLQLREEWVFDLHGLTVPPPDWNLEAAPTQTAESFTAVQLFLQSARRIQRHFAFTLDDLRSIVRMCRLFDGMPLAIEMAASWIRQLDCSEILQQIEADLDFLQLSVRNIPDRHRTLRAVFNHSWQMLEPSEAAVMRKLTVFRGSFSAAAAQAVASAAPETLAALVDKSFLQLNKQGGEALYSAHALLRQFAAERLDERPAERAQAEAAHAALYAGFVERRTEAVKSGRQTAAYDEIAAVIDEIRAAWEWSLSNKELQNVACFMEGLFYFYWARGWLQEGAIVAKQAAQAVANANSQDSVLFLQAWVWQAEFYGWLGKYEEALAIYKQVLNTCRERKAIPELVFALNGLGRIHYWKGEYATAEEIFNEAVALASRMEDGYWLSLSLNGLATTFAEAQRDYARARALYEQSLEISQQIDDQFGTARALTNLGTVVQEQGHLNEASQYYADSLAIYRELQYQHGIAAALNYLGQVAYLSGDYARAQSLIQESYDLNWESGDRRGLAEALMQLGNAAREAADFSEAKRRYDEALRLAQELEGEKISLAILMETAVLLSQIGQPESAQTLLIYVANHQSAGRELTEAAQELLANFRPQLPEARLAKSRNQAKVLTLEAAVRLFLDSASSLEKAL